MNARGYSVIPLVITGNNERMSETFITTALLQNPLIDVLIGTVKQGTAISGVLLTYLTNPALRAYPKLMVLMLSLAAFILVVPSLSLTGSPCPLLLNTIPDNTLVRRRLDVVK